VLGPADDGRGIDHIRCGSISRHHGLCSYNHNDYNGVTFNMDMGRISAVTLKLVKDLIGPTYQQLNWCSDDVDLFIPHQVGERPFLKVLDIVGVTQEKSIATFPKLGNLASATVPVCYNRMKEQDEGTGAIIAGFEDANGQFGQRNCGVVHWNVLIV
jgi:3-oxoacyl-[acyl-carrier-protein] synthase III